MSEIQHKRKYNLVQPENNKCHQTEFCSNIYNFLFQIILYTVKVISISLRVIFFNFIFVVTLKNIFRSFYKIKKIVLCTQNNVYLCVPL